MVNLMVDRRMVAFGAAQLRKYYGYSPYYDYIWAGPLAGQYNPALLRRPHKNVQVDQWYYQAARAMRYPPYLPPLACAAPEHTMYLRAHWAYMLGIHPIQVPLVPVTDPTLQVAASIANWIGCQGSMAKLGGFKVELAALPLERLVIVVGGAQSYMQIIDLTWYGSQGTFTEKELWNAFFYWLRDVTMFATKNVSRQPRPPQELPKYGLYIERAQKFKGIAPPFAQKYDHADALTPRLLGMGLSHLSPGTLCWFWVGHKQRTCGNEMRRLCLLGYCQWAT